MESHTRTWPYSYKEWTKNEEVACGIRTLARGLRALFSHHVPENGFGPAAAVADRFRYAYIRVQSLAGYDVNYEEDASRQAGQLDIQYWHRVWIRKAVGVFRNRIQQYGGQGSMGLYGLYGKKNDQYGTNNKTPSPNARAAV